MNTFIDVIRTINPIRVFFVPTNNWIYEIISMIPKRMLKKQRIL